MKIKGRVYQSTGSFYSVKDEAGNFWRARLKGRFKISKHTSSSNPIAVGDWVQMEALKNEEKEAVISDIVDRDNYIIRTSPQNRHHKHIIASNLDLACLVITVTQPVTSFGFIDRFLITTEVSNIPCVLIINKSDLITQENESDFHRILDIYKKIGYEIHIVSAKNGEGIDKLEEKLFDKNSLFTGHSGVGKTTLINRLIPGFQLKTKSVSEWSGKGQHTTTFAEMFDWPNKLNTAIVDTPGIKEWGLQEVERSNLSHFFPEMLALLPSCRFNNCLHVNEPHCAIKDALKNGEIAQERYSNYILFLEELERPF